MRVVDAEREHRKMKRKFYKIYSRMRRSLKDRLKRHLRDAAPDSFRWRIQAGQVNLRQTKNDPVPVLSITMHPHYGNKKETTLYFEESLATFPRTIATQLMLIAP